MATEYGARDKSGAIDWSYTKDRGRAEHLCVTYGWTLVAREVSEPRIVSIRA